MEHHKSSHCISLVNFMHLVKNNLCTVVIIIIKKKAHIIYSTLYMWSIVNMALYQLISTKKGQGKASKQNDHILVNTI